MALKDRIGPDVYRIFLNLDHFAEWHTWNGAPLRCVTDDEVALKRKNNNVVDISWDNNTTETVVYARVEGFPGRAEPNEHVVFDNRPMRVLQRQCDMGVYTILLCSNEPRRIGLE